MHTVIFLVIPLLLHCVLCIYEKRIYILHLQIKSNESGHKNIVILDAKSTSTAKFSQQIQVAFYYLVLNGVIEQEKLDGISVSISLSLSLLVIVVAVICCCFCCFAVFVVAFYHLVLEQSIDMLAYPRRCNCLNVVAVVIGIAVAVVVVGFNYKPMRAI